MSAPAALRLGRIQWGALMTGVLGLLLFFVGARIDPRQAFFSYLAAFAFGLSIALGALILLMTAHVLQSRWFVVLRRPGEAVASTLPLFALLFVPLLFGLEVLYPWARVPATLTPELQETIDRIRIYLNEPFFIGRAVLYFAVWSALALLLRRWSLRQDRAPDPQLLGHPRLLSAIGLLAVLFTLTFAAFDWLMSLQPFWASAAWGMYYFAGGVLGALALFGVIAYHLQRDGDERVELTASHFHALGKLLFTALLVWAYVAYSQYLIVWIGDLPREVIWYIPRVRTSWRWIALLLVVGHFALPFLALLSWRLKRQPLALAWIGGWVVLMHFVDIYWLVLPSLHPLGVRVHWLDLVSPIAVLGTATAFAAWRLRSAPVVPVGDPRLAESREYDTR